VAEDPCCQLSVQTQRSGNFDLDVEDDASYNSTMSIQAEVRPIDVVTEEATQVLIREARRRQRRRRLLIAGAVFILAVTGGIATMVISADGSRPVARPRPLTPKSPEPPIIVVGQFAGTWHVHTTSVNIQASGRGSVVWPGPLGPGESEATAPPGTAELQMTSVSGDEGTALVTGSTEVSVLPDGSAQLHITSQDLLYLSPDGPTSGSPFGRSGLCGSSAAALTLTQQNAAGINCGA